MAIHTCLVTYIYIVTYICLTKFSDVGFCLTKFKLCPTKIKSDRTNVLSRQIFICSPARNRSDKCNYRSLTGIEPAALWIRCSALTNWVTEAASTLVARGRTSGTRVRGQLSSSNHKFMFLYIGYTAMFRLWVNIKISLDSIIVEGSCRWDLSSAYRLWALVRKSA